MFEHDDEPIDPEREYRRLLRFLTRDGPRFGLAHAIARDASVADELRWRAIVELAGQGVRAATLEFGSKDERHDLVQLMVDAVGSGETRVDALFVSGLEFLLLDSAGQPRHAPSISNLNQRRDALPRLLDARVVFWVVERAYEAYAVELRDTREVMLSTFRFPQTIARYAEPGRSSELPGWFTVFDEDARMRLREQTALHEQLYAGASGLAAAEFAANVARIRLSVGDIEDALLWLERAATQFEQLGRADKAIDVIRRAIEAELFRGNHASVERWVARGLALAAGEARGYCQIERLHAESLRRRGRLDDALALLHEVDGRASNAGLERERAEASNVIADVLMSRGDYDGALEVLQRSLAIYERLGDVASRAVASSLMADVFEARGQLDEALRIRQEELLPTFERLGDDRSRAVILGKVADIWFARGQLDEALRIWQDEELPVYERLGDIRSRANTLGRVADTLRIRGQLDEALRIRRDEQLPVYERLGDVQSRAGTLDKIADILVTLGQHDEAIHILRDQVLPVYEQIGNIRSIAITQANLALLLDQRGRPEDPASVRELVRSAHAALRRMGLPEAAMVEAFMHVRAIDP